eukprot:1398717-Amphidinium_carterae.1
MCVLGLYFEESLAVQCHAMAGIALSGIWQYGIHRGALKLENDRANSKISERMKHIHHRWHAVFSITVQTIIIT